MSKANMIELPQTVADHSRNFSGRTWLLPIILDWLENTSERLFILTGEPGAGKSMAAAWLAAEGLPPEDTQDKQRLERIRAYVKAAHFCQAASGNTSPKALAQALTTQLQVTLPGFDQALLKSLGEHLHVTVQQQAGTLESGAVMTGLQVNRLDLAGLGDEFSFDRLFRDPIKDFFQSGFSETILIIIDSLDEALTYTGSASIVTLLSKLSDLPVQVRLLATARSDPRVLKFFTAEHKFDLILDAPPGQEDVPVYIRKRLGVEQAPDRAPLAERIGQAADGNFLYAHLVISGLLPHLGESRDLSRIAIPKGLGGVYQDFLNRELGKDEDRWYEAFRPVLGLVAVSQGDGLTRMHIGRLTGREVESVLRACKQYLDGDLPDGPFRVFHRSFADFLLEDDQNLDYHIDPARLHLKIADAYCPPVFCEEAWKDWDDYGMRFTLTHLVEAVRRLEAPDRRQPLERLVNLAAHPAFQKLYLERLRDLAALQRDLELSLRTAAVNPDPQAILLIVKMSLALESYRRSELQPNSIFELARQGDVDGAERRLSLFEVDLDWRQAVLLTIAWLAAAKSPAAALRLRDQLRDDIPASGPLPILLERFNAALEGRYPINLPTLPEPPPEDIVKAIVRRIGGQGSDPELLNTLGLGSTENSARGYLAEVDGPPLVAYTAAHPQDKDALFRQYLSTHTRYNYVEYRNRSLWLLMQSVLLHSEQTWVLKILPEMGEAALAGNSLEFRESLPLTVLGLRAAAGLPGALESFNVRLSQAFQEASSLDGVRRLGDVWGIHKRQLSILAQALALLLHRADESRSLLNKALELPYGLAGFQWPACLALAEAISICRPTYTGDGSQEEIDQALQNALVAAHNIQDATFCARSTARVNAFQARWWPTEGFDPAAAIQHLHQDPNSPEFTALHIVGELYEERREENNLRLPVAALQANTLEMLAEVYQRPLADFQRANESQGWSVNRVLEPGTLVNVPDPGFITHLAARFAAQALVDPGLTPDQRRVLIQSLVPVAAPNPTLLDTLLARLLLAAPLAERETLDALQEILSKYPNGVKNIDLNLTEGLVS